MHSERCPAFVLRVDRLAKLHPGKFGKIFKCRVLEVCLTGGSTTSADPLIHKLDNFCDTGTTVPLDWYDAPNAGGKVLKMKTVGTTRKPFFMFVGHSSTLTAGDEILVLFSPYEATEGKKIRLFPDSYYRIKQCSKKKSVSDSVASP